MTSLANEPEKRGRRLEMIFQFSLDFSKEYLYAVY